MGATKHKVLKKTFGQRREQVVGKWSEGLHDLYSTLNIFWVFRSRRMGYEGHVVCMLEHINA